MTDIRERYKELKAQADAAWEAAEPQRKALREAEKPWHLLCGMIDQLIDGQEVVTCEGCGEPIFDGDKRHHSTDGVSCEQCAPDYEDLLQNAWAFLNADDEPMTPDEAKRICDEHVAAGGKLTDSMAS